MAIYDVQITATVTKTIRVEADSEDEAVEFAHQEFVAGPEDGVAENYEEEHNWVKKIS